MVAVIKLKFFDTVVTQCVCSVEHVDLLYCRPVVVQSSWLLECCRRQRRVKEDDHIPASLVSLNKDEPTLDNANIRKRFIIFIHY